jgi:serine protease Do
MQKKRVCKGLKGFAVKFEKYSLVIGSVAGIVLSLGIAGTNFLLYRTISRQQELERQLFELRDQHLEVRDKIGVADTQVVERIVGTAQQLWRPVQEKVKDTVVQVFSQITEYDFLQPYKTPGQTTAFGSGFFISDTGDLITNSHVVDQAKAVWIQIPSLGKRIIDVEIIGISPERDLALLRLKPESLALVRSVLGSVPFLPLGDSDLVRRSDEVMALGYPLGQQSLKSTTGVVSGQEQHFIQISAPLNPGNSGGPLLNIKGEVIGINSAIIPGAQNVGYMIPINDLKIVRDDLAKIKLLRKPFLGVLFNNASDSLTEYLGNPQPGGCYVVEVVRGSTLDKAGIKAGDMIYEINGHRIDIFGEMSVSWSEDKISLIDYVGRLSVGQKVNLVIYRHGKRMEMKVTFGQGEVPAIRRIYPGYEEIDYEVFGGMVIMELSLNHINILGPNAPGLARFAELKQQAQKTLVVTHIFPTSQIARERTLSVGATLNEVNGVEVHTLADFRNAVITHGLEKYFTIRASDNVTRATDNVFVSIAMEKIVDEELQMARDYHYPVSKLSEQLILAAGKQPKGPHIELPKTGNSEPKAIA